MYSGGLKDYILRIKVKDKENLNNPLKGWRILSAISSMVFHTVTGSDFRDSATPQQFSKLNGFQPSLLVQLVPLCPSDNYRLSLVKRFKIICLP